MLSFLSPLTLKETKPAWNTTAFFTKSTVQLRCRGKILLLLPLRTTSTVSVEVFIYIWRGTSLMRSSKNTIECDRVSCARQGIPINAAWHKDPHRGSQCKNKGKWEERNDFYQQCKFWGISPNFCCLSLPLPFRAQQQGPRTSKTKNPPAAATDEETF